MPAVETTSSAPGPGRALVAQVGPRVARWFAGVPATWVLALFVAAGPLLPLVEPVRAGTLAHAPHVVLTSLLAASGPWSWAFGLLGVLVLGPPAERAGGSGRFVLRVLLGHLVSVLAVVGLTLLTGAVDPAWGAVLARDPVLGPWPGLTFALLLASAQWPALWRRRLMTALVPLALAATLFSGSPEDAAVCVAVLLGAGLACRAARRSGRDVVPMGSRNERRVLIAASMAAVVLGTVVALGSPHLVGPLAGARGLFAAGDVSPDVVAAACADDARVRECARGTYILTATGTGAVLLAAMPLVLQLVLADGLRRGRHAALVGTVSLQGLLAILAATHLGAVAWTVTVSPVDHATDAALLRRLVVPVLVPLGVLVLVLAHRRLFQARAPRGTYRFLQTALAVAWAVCVGLTVLVGLAVPGQFSPRPDVDALVFGGVLALLPSTALTVFTPAALPNGPIARLLLEWLPLVPWLLAVVLAWRAQHPLRSERLSGQTRGEAVRAFASEDATMAWMGTWEGCRLWRSGSRAAAVAYRVHQDVALTVGDPLIRAWMVGFWRWGTVSSSSIRLDSICPMAFCNWKQIST